MVAVLYVRWCKGKGGGDADVIKRNPKYRLKAHVRRLGALNRRGFRFEKEEKRFLVTPWGDGLALFHNPREVNAVVRKFEELGLSDLLDPVPPRDDPFDGNGDAQTMESICVQAEKSVDGLQRICDALGACAASIETFGEGDPESWRKFGDREAEAWFLVNFAEFYSRQNDPNADLEWRLIWAQTLGRLMEWWRWRNDGYDANAVRGNAFDPMRPARRRERRPSKEKIFRDNDILERAQQLLDMGKARFAGSGKINGRVLSKQIISTMKLRIGESRVSSIVREAIRNGKLRI